MSKPRPVLSQMPWNVKQLIVDSGDTETKIALRPVSKEYTHIVSRSQISFEQLLFQLDSDEKTAKIIFVPYLGQTMKLEYFHNEMGYKVKRLGIMGNLVRDKSFVEAAANQFVKVLQNPKVLIKKFRVYFSGFDPIWELEELEVLKNEVLDRLKAFFVSLAHPIHVRKLHLHCDTQHDILKVLPFLQAGTLKSIALKKPRSDRSECDLSEVAETEQWKLAEDLEVKILNLCLPVEKWSHFSFTRIDIPDLTVSKMKSIFNSFINSTKWWWCEILCDDLVQQPLVDYFKELGTHVADDNGYHEFTIHTPNSRKVTVRIIACYVYLA